MVVLLNSYVVLLDPSFIRGFSSVLLEFICLISCLFAYSFFLSVSLFLLGCYLIKSELQDSVKGEEKAAAAFILCDTCRERNIGEEVDTEMGPY